MSENKVFVVLQMSLINWSCSALTKTPPIDSKLQGLILSAPAQYVLHSWIPSNYTSHLNEQGE